MLVHNFKRCNSRSSCCQGINLDSVERNEIVVIVGGVGESCEISVGGVECEDRTTEDDVNQVTYLLNGFLL